MKRLVIFTSIAMIAAAVFCWFLIYDDTHEGTPHGIVHNVKVIAHRGASAYAPENTLAAFRKAVELGADIIELDIHQTKDSQIVVIHDATVDRTTNGRGKIADHTLDELRQLNAGSWFSPSFVNEKIPLLQEVFERTPDSVLLLIELKAGSPYYPDIEKRVIHLIRGEKAVHRVIIKSFQDDILETIRAQAPDIPRLKVFVTEISLLNIIIEHGINFGTVLDDSVQYLQHHWFGLSDDFLNASHQKGYTVFAWGVNSERQMRSLIAKGIDGIETDYPDKLRSLLSPAKP